MEIIPRPAQSRGHADHGWLKSAHSFSFADYWDPDWTGFGVLRVINEDHIAPSTGFGTHGHTDMEIISWPLAGRMRHQDSLGNGADLTPGTTQVMSAGRGIRHSEMNPGPEPVHFMQMWIEPASTGGQPRYADRTIPPEHRHNRWATLAAPEGSPEVSANQALPIRQQAWVRVADLDRDTTVDVNLAPGRRLWLQLTKGAVTIDGPTPFSLTAGDGCGILATTLVRLKATRPSQILAFDLP